MSNISVFQVDKIGEGYDLVCGWKHDRKDPLEKKVLSKVFNGIVASFSGVKLHDMNCGFKAFKKEVAEKINIYGELHRFIPVLVSWEGYRIAEIKVKHNPRKYGTSKYGASRILKVFLILPPCFFLPSSISVLCIYLKWQPSFVYFSV